MKARNEIPAAIAELIQWRLDDPKYRSTQMQRQWTIEARGDFADEKKNAAVDQLFRTFAAKINANMVLIADGQPPQVVCFSDDFFHGHKDIQWLGEQVGPNMETEQTSVSDEMLQAVREMNK